MSHEPLRDWLRANSAINELHQEIMMLRYDLDGALGAHQSGLAWWTQENLLICSMHLYLARLRIDVPYSEDRLDRAFRVIEALDRVSGGLSREAWNLWLRSFPSDDELEQEITRTLDFMVHRLNLPWTMSREGVVIQWASNTRVLRSVAKQFGVAQSDDWYLSDSSDGTFDVDWYTEILTALAAERKDRGEEWSEAPWR